MDFGRLLADPIMQHAVVKKNKSMLDFWSVWKNSEKVREFWLSLGGPHSATYGQGALRFYS